MAKPTSVTLSAKEQKAVIKEAKTTKNARTIASSLSLPRYQVMLTMEKHGLASYSDGSYA